MSVTVKHLAQQDAGDFRHIRLEGFRLQDREFRSSPEDEASVVEAAARLEQDFVVGAYEAHDLIGIAGLSRVIGTKLKHKALLWGMYVRAAHRGSGVSDAIMRALVDRARLDVESIILTVVNGNRPAVRFYERWGFRTYGVEPASVRLADGSYLDEALMIRRLA